RVRLRTISCHKLPGQRILDAYLFHKEVLLFYVVQTSRFQSGFVEAYSGNSTFAHRLRRAHRPGDALPRIRLRDSAFRIQPATEYDLKGSRASSITRGTSRPANEERCTRRLL